MEVNMEKQPWFLRVSGELAQALNGHYAPMLQTLLQDAELQGGDLWAAQVALSEDPNPITADVLLERTPYMTAEQVYKQLVEAAEHGVLTAVSIHTYQLTNKGRTFAQSVQPAVAKAASGLTPIPLEKMTQLSDYLRQIVNAAVAADEPAKPSLIRSRFYEPGADAPVLEQIRRSLNDLAAFRDDVHIAAWRTYDLDGHEWEAFSHSYGEFVFGEPANTGEALAEKLGSFRGHDAASYTVALQKVATRGWLVETDGRFTITNEGKQVLQAVEDETDRLFYAPWSLSADELTTLQSLMEVVRDRLKPPEFKETWALLDEAQQHIGTHFWPVLQSKNEEVGFEGWDLALTRRAGSLDNGLTADHMLAFIPYGHANVISDRLNQTITRGFVEANNNGGFVATTKGRQGVKLVLEAAETAVSALPHLADDKMSRLSSLLGKLSESFVNSETLTEKPAVLDSREFSSSEIKSVLWQINRYMVDAFAFRDDAHVAAWKAIDVPGHQWEAFSHVWGENIWGDKVDTIAAVAQKLAFRGYDEAMYTAVLTDCVARGWLTVDDAGVYTVTEAGQALRQEAETTTDNNFYAPWTVFTVPERIELHTLLTELSELLKPKEE
jgi:hypothetical protein